MNPDLEGVCGPCGDGDHEDCTGWSAETGGCMCIDMEHDEDED